MSKEIVSEKIVNEYPAYSVTRGGEIYSLNYRMTGKRTLLKTRLNNEGYLLVGLTKNGKQKTFTVHRLVAITFLDNPSNKPQVNHIDGDKLNNAVSNLEWCTASENTNHTYSLISLEKASPTYRTNRKDRIRKYDRFKKTPEFMIREIRELRGIYKLRELSEAYGLSIGTISKINNNRI